MLRRLIASHASAERTRYLVGSGQSAAFNGTFLLNRSDERQQSGRIKAVGRWFESGRCVGAFSHPKNCHNLIGSTVVERSQK